MPKVVHATLGYKPTALDVEATQFNPNPALQDTLLAQAVFEKTSATTQDNGQATDSTGRTAKAPAPKRLTSAFSLLNADHVAQTDQLP